MQTHPIPQNIQSYEFRLVGDMTLKQFFQLAGGIVVALIFYATPLAVWIKWPLVIFFSFLGVALAFFPLEERPLATWIAAFFKAVYSPTIYEWKPGKAENVFAAEAEAREPVMITPQGKAKAEEYLKKIPQPHVLEIFENAEKAFMDKITSLFQHGPTAPGPAEEESISVPLPQLQEMPIPAAPPVRVEPQTPQPPQIPQIPSYQPQKISPILSGQKPTNGAAQATFAAQASPPLPPERPNTVVGQVISSDGKIIEAAILEMRDANGRPVRALKTNKLGHFISVTPLPDGEYTLETEKEGFEFEKVKFIAKGELIEPILIKAK